MTKTKVRVPKRATGYGKGPVIGFAVLGFAVGTAAGLGLAALAIAEEFPVLRDLIDKGDKAKGAS